jgi:hypothetical protein
MAVAGRVGQEGHVAGALDGPGQHALVLGAVARLATRTDLASLGDIALEIVGFLVADLW